MRRRRTRAQARQPRRPPCSRHRSLRAYAHAGRTPPRPRVRYCRASAETFALAAENVDLVVSSPALHYVAGYDALIRRITSWLRPGGHLVYSVEHPVCTARDPMTGWVSTAEGTVWPVDHYTRDTARTQQWLGTSVTKHHRRVASLVGGIIAAGLTLTGIDEPYARQASRPRRSSPQTAPAHPQRPENQGNVRHVPCRPWRSLPGYLPGGLNEDHRRLDAAPVSAVPGRPDVRLAAALGTRAATRRSRCPRGGDDSSDGRRACQRRDAVRLVGAPRPADHQR